MMNTINTAALVARLVSLQMVFYALINLSYIPQYLFNIQNARSNVTAEYGRLEIASLIFRTMTEILAGVALYFLAGSVARVLAHRLLGQEKAV